MTFSLYPQTHLTVTDEQPYVADWSAACRAAGVSEDDEEIAIVEVDEESAISAIVAAGNRLPPHTGIDDQVRYLAVFEAGQSYVRLLYVQRTGPAIEQEYYRRA